MEDMSMFMGRLKHENIKSYLDSERFCTECNETVDSLNLEKQELKKYIGKEILTGNEEWHYCNENKTYYYNQFNKLIVDNNSARMMSNYFTFVNDLKTKIGTFSNGVKQEIHFNYDNGEKGVDNFKNWLKEKYYSGKPVEVYYVLQYPVIINRRFYYNSNPRIDIKYISTKASNGNLSPIINVKSEIDVENNDNIYKKNRNK